MSNTVMLPTGIEIKAPTTPEMSRILTPEALAFVARLAREFQSTRAKLLARRSERQSDLDAGALPDFLSATEAIRDSRSRTDATSRRSFTTRIYRRTGAY